MSLFIKKAVFEILGTFSGILSVIFSFVIKRLDAGTYELAAKYGGDAYTGIQNAAAKSANNIIYLNEAVKSGFSYILLIAGIALIAHFGKKLYEIYLEEKPNFVTAPIEDNEEYIPPVEIQGEIFSEDE